MLSMEINMKKKNARNPGKEVPIYAEACFYDVLCSFPQVSSHFLPTAQLRASLFR